MIGTHKIVQEVVNGTNLNTVSTEKYEKMQAREDEMLSEIPQGETSRANPLTYSVN